jgi:two-component system cell cycle sensor histidine kinase/response regulator CckA
MHKTEPHLRPPKQIRKTAPSSLILKLMVLVFAAAFALSFKWLYGFAGEMTPVFGFSYICLAAWVWGLRGGLLAALLNIPFIGFLHKLAGISLPTGFLGPVFVFAVAGLVGKLSGMRKKLLLELEHRQKAEEELKRTQDNLVQEVEERTRDYARANEELRQEVAERKGIEAELNRSRERFFKIFKRSPLWMTLSGLDGGAFLDVNDSFSQITGYSRDQALGKTPLDLDLWINPAQWTRAMERIRDAGPPQNFEMDFRSHSGEDGQVLCSAEVVHLDERPCVILAARDVTGIRRAEREKEQLESQLRQAQKMDAVGILAGGIAHDFNNILTTIIGYGELAQEAAMDGQANSAQLEQIITAAERARDLVKQLLTFSRRSETEMKPVDLNRLLARAIQMLQPVIPKMINIQIKPSDGISSIKADPAQLELVIVNLVNNASDAMPDGGGLVFETRPVVWEADLLEPHLDLQPGKYVLLSVTDTGTGMDRQTLEQIFDPFFTTKDIGEGTGLGLSTVYGIVKEHGGHISCVSEPGRGTTFEIYLPAIEEAAGPLETRKPRQKAPLGNGELLLLVDDENSIRKMGAKALTAAGYRILTAASGEEALEAYEKARQEISLVVLDLGMPGMGGHKCLQELLALDPALKVLIASGYSAEGRVKDTLQAGAAGYIGKPFKRAALLNAIRSVLDG